MSSKFKNTTDYKNALFTQNRNFFKGQVILFLVNLFYKSFSTFILAKILKNFLVFVHKRAYLWHYNIKSFAVYTRV